MTLEPVITQPSFQGVINSPQDQVVDSLRCSRSSLGPRVAPSREFLRSTRCQCLELGELDVPTSIFPEEESGDDM